MSTCESTWILRDGACYVSWLINGWCVYIIVCVSRFISVTAEGSYT